jgi:hypothetical protein
MPQMAVVGISEVLGRWAYSEIVGGSLKHGYDGREGIDDLRSRWTGGCAYNDLSAAEKCQLGLLCVLAHPTPFVRYLAEIRRFKKVELTKDDLSRVQVMPELDDDMLQGKFMRLAYFMMTYTTNPMDCRNERLPARGYITPSDLLTIGVQNVMVDGYRRAISFMRWAPVNATIHAYVPLEVIGSSIAD